MLQYCAGYITPDAILCHANIATWANTWLDKARKAESEGNQFIVFEVPKNGLLFSQGVAEMQDPEQFELYPFTFDMCQLVDTDLLAEMERPA